MKNIISDIIDIIRPQNTKEIIFRIFGIIGIFQMVGMIIGTYEMNIFNQIMATLVITLICLFGTCNRK